MSSAKSFEFEVLLKSGKKVVVEATRMTYAVPDSVVTLLCLYKGNTLVFATNIDKVDTVTNLRFAKGGSVVGLNRIRA
jgi:hypothetical protein